MKQKSSRMIERLSTRMYYNLMELTVNEPARHSYVVNNRTFYRLLPYGYCKWKDPNWSTPILFGGFTVYMQGDMAEEDQLKDGVVLFMSQNQPRRMCERDLTA